MINTYHSNFNLPSMPPPVPPLVPPPVPPRASSRQSYKVEHVLGTNTPLVKFLAWMVLLLMVIMFGGFFYLFNNSKSQKMTDTSIMSQQKITQSRVDAVSIIGPSNIPQARLIPKYWDKNTLLWDETHSLIHNIGLSKSGELTIDTPGYYFIHSQVTYSKSHPKEPLRQIVWTRKSKNENQGTNEQKEENLMTCYCNVPQSGVLCTASQTGIFKLEKGQKILVNVTDASLLNLATTVFGLFKLQD